MTRTRRQHSKAFKFKVALEAISEQKSISEIASEYEVHPTRIHLEEAALPRRVVARPQVEQPAAVRLLAGEAIARHIRTRAGVETAV